MQLFDLAETKTEALAAARHVDLQGGIATVNQPIGEDEVAQTPPTRPTMREAPRPLQASPVAVAGYSAPDGRASASASRNERAHRSTS